jgi:hypothetical protein
VAIPGPSTEEAERFRRAAEQALDQLEWCIGYLNRIHKSDLATALARNRSAIRRKLNDADEEFRDGR